MKKLGIIVPIYNMEMYLKECLESICKQTYKDLEIILVDDGSTDHSSKICDDYSKIDERITVIHQENSGLLKARHNGLLACSCEYATFVDADDWIDLNTYELVSVYMEKEIDVIAFGKILERGDKGRTFPKLNYEIGEYNRTKIENDIFPTMIWDFKRNGIGITQSLCDKVIKKNLLLRSYELTKKLGNVYHAEDSLILYPLMQWIQSMCILEECPYHYRKTTDAVPVYMRNDDFFDKLYIWYKHITNHVTEIPNVRRQIEYLYIYFAESRKACYRDISIKEEYMFPFEMIPAGCKIALWGAGKVGKIYHNQIERINYCTKVVWVDSNYNLYSGYGVQDSNIVNSHLNIDYVVIAVASESVKEVIVSRLLAQGIPENKIIWHNK